MLPRQDAHTRPLLLFCGLALLAAFLRSLVALPGALEVGDAVLKLSRLPLYSALAVLERLLSVLAAFWLLAWLLRPGARRVWEGAAGAVLGLALLAQLARMADGAAALLVLALALRRWLGLPLVAALSVLALGVAGWVSTRPVGTWVLGPLSFSVTHPSDPETVLVGLLRVLAQLAFALLAAELALRLSREQERLALALRELDAARDRERELLALEERAALSRELHDTLGHHLTALNLHAQRAEMLADGAEIGGTEAGGTGKMQELRGSLTQVRQQGRAAVASLAEVVRATRSDAAGRPILAQLEALCRHWPAPVIWEAQGIDRPLPDPLALTAYRTCQEALTNAGKHAPGQPVTVRACLSVAGLTLNVCNPAPSASPSPVRSGYGLSGLSERAGRCGGTLDTHYRGGIFCLSLNLPTQPTQPTQAAQPTP